MEEEVRFEEDGGIKDLPRFGASRKYGQEDVLRIVNTVCGSLKEPYTHWSVRRIAEEYRTGMRKSGVHDVLNGLDIKPHQYKM